jgi:phytoene dehydrogenase-like protein
MTDDLKTPLAMPAPDFGKLPALADVIVVGSGHNALICALLLARAGRKVVVLEAKHRLGGACVTEKPFAKAPELAASTGAYLFGVMPPELIQTLALDLPLKRRDPHYFLPTTDRRSLLIGSDRDKVRQQYTEFFSEQDWDAHVAMNEEIAQIRDDLAPAWLLPPKSVEETAEHFIRPALRDIFVRLVRGTIADYLARFPFKSALVQAMYATTDGFSGLRGGWDTPGTGHNFLAHNMCRLPNADGTWMVVEGGMGTITQKISEAARAAGAYIETDAEVSAIDVEEGVVRGVTLARGDVIRAPIVVSGADPFRTRAMVGASKLPDSYNEKLDGLRRDGTTMKVNLAFDRLPQFTCLPEDRGQFGGTTHLLPMTDDPIASLRQAFDDVCRGKLTEEPTIEWYFHTATDASTRDKEGRHSGALFVQWVPYELSDGKSWAEEESRYVKHLLSICDRFAPGTSECVVDSFVLTPPKIEEHFGMTRGHIHHVDNCFAFDERAPYAMPIGGLFQCGAGTHPAGAVIGAGGHNAAKLILNG